jgi:hypothetical protein
LFEVPLVAAHAAAHIKWPDGLSPLGNSGTAEARLSRAARSAATSSRLTAGYRESLTTARKADSFGMSSAACRPPPLPKPYASVGDEGHMSLAQALTEKARHPSAGSMTLPAPY